MHRLFVQARHNRRHVSHWKQACYRFGVSKQCCDASVECVQFVVAGFGDLGGKFADDDVFGKIFVGHQFQALEIGKVEGRFLGGFFLLFLILAALGFRRKFAAERFDQM